MADFLTSFTALFLRIFPILIGAVFLAETASLWLGQERLRRLLTGSGPWQGRLRAAAMGAALPFCECGAFPILIALLRAGVPLKVALTFFTISPVVSVPAFMLLAGLFSLHLALAYLAIVVTLGLLTASVLSSLAQKRKAIKDILLRSPEGYRADFSDNKDSTSARKSAKDEVAMSENERCCKTDAKKTERGPFYSLLCSGMHETARTLFHLLPVSVAAIIVAAILKSAVSDTMIETTLSFAAPFDVIIAAAAGIPIYTGDCTMFALVAPLIDVTGAAGPGIAFIIAGAGTSINGLIFMSSIFTKTFILAFAASIFFIAIAAGYLIGFML